MEKNIMIGTLYQYYKDLLSEKQRASIEQYYIEDLSLTEIAEIQGVSKQAVSTNIKRGETLLEEYEQKLKLYSRFNDVSNGLEELSALIYENTDKQAYETIKEKISVLMSKLN